MLLDSFSATWSLVVTGQFCLLKLFLDCSMYLFLFFKYFYYISLFYIFTFIYISRYCVLALF